MQNRNGRRGAVFSTRLTDEQRERLEELQREMGGPRGLGPWLVWRALEAPAGTTRARVIPAENAGKTAIGTTRSSGLRVYTSTPQHVDRSQRVILDLCAGSGSWSAPYVEAGYRVERVTLPDADVRTYVPPRGVWGVLCAPPCDQFSIARNGCDSPRDFLRGLECVNACLRIVLTCRPRWWALENPVGLLSRWLGTPRDVWEPCDFGDPWTKRTAIWGDYTLPTRGPFVAPLGGGPPCDDCKAPRATIHCNNPAHRARTPPGFARAFFEANP